MVWAPLKTKGGPPSIDVLYGPIVLGLVICTVCCRLGVVTPLHVCMEASCFYVSHGLFVSALGFLLYYSPLREIGLVGIIFLELALSVLLLRALPSSLPPTLHARALMSWPFLYWARLSSSLGVGARTGGGPSGLGPLSRPRRLWHC